MKVLVDTHVILDFLLDRQPFAAAAMRSRAGATASTDYALEAKLLPRCKRPPRD